MGFGVPPLFELSPVPRSGPPPPPVGAAGLGLLLCFGCIPPFPPPPTERQWDAAPCRRGSAGSRRGTRGCRVSAQGGPETMGGVPKCNGGVPKCNGGGPQPTGSCGAGVSGQRGTVGNPAVIPCFGVGQHKGGRGVTPRLGSGAGGITLLFGVRQHGVPVGPPPRLGWGTIGYPWGRAQTGDRRYGVPSSLGWGTTGYP